MTFLALNPESLAPPKGFNHGWLTKPGYRALFVAGQIGCDEQGVVESDDFVEQFAKALDNALEVVRAAGGTPSHVVRLTIYVTNMDAYRASQKALGAAYRDRMGKHFPAMALVAVSELVEPRAQVEMEATAMVP